MEPVQYLEVTMYLLEGIKHLTEIECVSTILRTHDTTFYPDTFAD